MIIDMLRSNRVIAPAIDRDRTSKILRWVFTAETAKGAAVRGVKLKASFCAYALILLDHSVLGGQSRPSPQFKGGPTAGPRTSLLFLSQ